MKYVDSIVSGIDIKPGMLKNVKDVGYMRYDIEGKDSISILRGYNEHSKVIFSGPDKEINVDLNSRLDFASLSGCFMTNEGNYYITLDNDFIDIVVEKAKPYEQIKKEVEDELKDKLYHEQLGEINRRLGIVGEGKDAVRRYRKCRITFFNTESLSYFDERLSNWINDYYTVNSSLSDQGIEPTSFFEFYVDTDEEVVRIANQFYLNPYSFISSMESKKDNVVSL